MIFAHAISTNLSKIYNRMLPRFIRPSLKIAHFHPLQSFNIGFELSMSLLPSILKRKAEFRAPY